MNGRRSPIALVQHLPLMHTRRLTGRGGSCVRQLLCWQYELTPMSQGAECAASAFDLPIQLECNV